MATTIYRQNQGLAVPRGAGPSLDAGQQGVDARIIARSQSRVWKDIARAGNNIMGIVAHDVNRRDDSDRAVMVTKALGEYKQILNRSANEYTENNQGELALGAGEVFAKTAITARDEVLGNLGADERVRSAFLQHAAGVAMQYEESGHGYAARQKQLWKSSVLAGDMSTYQQEVAKNWNNEEYVSHQQALIKERLVAMNPGIDNRALFAEVEAKTKAIQKTQLEAVLGGLVEGDPAGAEAMLSGLKGRANVVLPENLQKAVGEAARLNKLDPELVMRVIATESGGKIDALSPAGARGLMQLMPDTAKELGVDPSVPQQNIAGGTQYLAQMLKRYNGDTAKALAAYNWGPGNMDAYIKTGKGVAGQEMPLETQNYVKRVLGMPSGKMAGLLSGEEIAAYSAKAEKNFLAEQSLADYKNLTVELGSLPLETQNTKMLERISEIKDVELRKQVHQFWRSDYKLMEAASLARQETLVSDFRQKMLNEGQSPSYVLSKIGTIEGLNEKSQKELREFYSTERDKDTPEKRLLVMQAMVDIDTKTIRTNDELEKVVFTGALTSGQAKELSAYLEKGGQFADFNLSYSKAAAEYKRVNPWFSGKLSLEDFKKTFAYLEPGKPVNEATLRKAFANMAMDGEGEGKWYKLGASENLTYQEAVEKKQGDIWLPELSRAERAEYGEILKNKGLAYSYKDIQRYKRTVIMGLPPVSEPAVPREYEDMDLTGQENGLGWGGI